MYDLLQHRVPRRVALMSVFFVDQRQRQRMCRLLLVREPIVVRVWETTVSAEFVTGDSEHQKTAAHAWSGQARRDHRRGESDEEVCPPAFQLLRDLQCENAAALCFTHSCSVFEGALPVES